MKFYDSFECSDEFFVNNASNTFEFDEFFDCDKITEDLPTLQQHDTTIDNWFKIHNDIFIKYLKESIIT